MMPAMSDWTEAETPVSYEIRSVVGMLLPLAARGRLAHARPVAGAQAQHEGAQQLGLAESLDGHPASVGLTEPALHPWDAGLLAQTARSSAPEPVTWVVEMGEASGTVTLTSSPRGVLEDLSLEVDAVVETVWPAVSDLLPLMMLTTRGGELTGAVLHPTVLPDVELTTRDIGGGYVSVVTHGAEAPVTERLP